MCAPTHGCWSRARVCRAIYWLVKVILFVTLIGALGHAVEVFVSLEVHPGVVEVIKGIQTVVIVCMLACKFQAAPLSPAPAPSTRPRKLLARLRDANVRLSNGSKRPCELHDDRAPGTPTPRGADFGPLVVSCIGVRNFVAAKDDGPHGGCGSGRCCDFQTLEESKAGCCCSCFCQAFSWTHGILMLLATVVHFAVIGIMYMTCFLAMLTAPEGESSDDPRQEATVTAQGGRFLAATSYNSTSLAGAAVWHDLVEQDRAADYDFAGFTDLYDFSSPTAKARRGEADLTATV